jgi:hypothetical protein
VMAGGLYLFGTLGGGATFGSLMPGFLMFGAGAGLMNVPLTNAIMQSMTPERSGIASALLNASREVAGLLGITIIGAVLRTARGSALRAGQDAAAAYLHGYHSGLIVTVALVAAGAVISFVALRRLPRPATAADEALVPAVAAELSGSAEPEIVRN